MKLNLKHGVNLGDLKWDSRAMGKPNVFPGDVLLMVGKPSRLMLVVHSSESSAKIIQVKESDLDDDECVFSASERGEVISSFICYNERGGGVSLVARIPWARVKVRESAVITSRPVADPQAAPRRAQRPVSSVPTRVDVSVITDGPEESVDAIVMAAQSAARTISASGLAA